MTEPDQIYNKLSSRTGSRGEVAEVALAEQLAANPDPDSVKALAEGLASKDKHLQADCIKVLYEIGYRDPAQIAPYAVSFLPLLNSRNNRLVWGGMIALSTIADRAADALFPHLEMINKVIECGSTITQDAGMSVLAGISCASERYAEKALPRLFDWLRTCRPKSVPQYAERALPAIKKESRQVFFAILQEREVDLSPTQMARIARIYKKLGVLA